MDRRVREVTHGAQFELSCRTLADSVSPAKIEELLRPVKWLIARGAEDFPCTVDGISIYRYERIDRYPSLVFYFTIDSETQCTLRLVRLVDE